MTSSSLALNAVVTQDGRVSGVSVLSTEGRHPREMSPMLWAISNARFEPGRMGAAPVAVNLVWLLAHTTVKAKAPRTTSAAARCPGASSRRLTAISGSRRQSIEDLLHPGDSGAFFTSVTAVATLFIASVARMSTLRPASLSSSRISNSSRRESAMPSLG